MAIDATDGPRSTKAGAPVEPKTFASGRFVVQRLLGEGGQKTVYLARDTQLNRDVAIAVIKTHGLDEAGIARVRREAETLAGLGAQPHIVTVYDIGQEQGPDGPPVPYLVCEHMAGGDLERELRQAGGPLSLERVLAIGQDVCRALDVAHRRGILHRDIKPGNIWLTEDGHAKLGDFGLAMALGQSRLTEAGTIMGTASYMPPEQALGTEVDVRGDLYAFGCLLYELVTGRPPFLGDDTIAVVSQHINTAPVAASWHRADLPRALDALIERLLEKSPEERPQSAAQVLELLAAIAAAPAGAGAAVLAEANSLDRLAGGVFVGRDQEAKQLRSRLEEIFSGQGRIVLLAGEPGVGKTRLAEELATYGKLRGARVLWGRCYEGEGAPAYWPWRQAVRSYLHDREADAIRSELGPGAADIAQVVSEVRERLPDLPPPPTLEPDQARFRLFDSITTFLRNASNRQPIVLVLDDLQWSDKPSLLLLQFLARELRGARLLVVATYRDTELSRQHPLSETLAVLAQEQIERVVLRGLAEHEVARFLELTLGIAPPPSLVAALYRETEGMPFFVSEVVRLLVADGRLERADELKSWTVTIPQSVREVIDRRLARLSAEAHEALTVASVIGREFGLDVLERVMELPGDRLLDSLEEAAGARVLAEAAGVVGRYSFTHALVRETLSEELSTTRRARLHRRIAEVLEEVFAGKLTSHLGELAYHFFEGARGGGDVGKAIEYTARAAEQATQLLAYEDAVLHYERTLQAMELQEAPDDPQRCGVLLALGEAHDRSGETLKAEGAFRRAADLARRLGAAEQTARAALGIKTAIGLFNERHVALLEEALGALGASGSPLRARLSLALAGQLYFSPARERALQLGGEAIEAAQRAGDPSALTDALSASHWAQIEPGALEERLHAATEVVRLADEAGDKDVALRARHWRIVDLLELGDVAAVDAELAVAAAAVDELRHPQSRWFITLLLGMRAMLDGRFEDAERLVQLALANGQRIQEPNAVLFFGVQLFTLRWEQGRLLELEGMFRGLAEQYAGLLAFRSALALLYAELGREEEARAELERLAVDGFAGLPKDQQWFTAVATIAQACAFLHDAPRAAALYDLLLPYEGRNITLPVGICCLGPVSHYLGVLAATMSDWAAAAGHFDQALAMSARMGARPFLAYTRYEYARLLIARGEPDDHRRARDLLQLADELAREIGMRKLVADCLGLQKRIAG